MAVYVQTEIDFILSFSMSNTMFSILYAVVFMYLIFKTSNVLQVKKKESLCFEVIFS